MPDLPNNSSLSTLASAALNSSSHSSSLISQNFTTNQTHLLFALKYRSGMSAITQEQLEQYAVLDTEEIVCQVFF